ncbi:MAG: CRISPR-associated helicase Cas3' [Ruminiclostridium sp.]|nr:CRISPR-associated helicase Cas3' [Ruminiclostridium sp.]
MDQYEVNAHISKMHSMLAKRNSDGKEETIIEHMSCSANIAISQYDRLPQGVKNLLPSRQLCVFLAAAHDLGKASPVFQLHIKEKKGRNEPRHWMISYKILHDKGFHKSICEIVAAHHGTPPDNSILNKLKKGSYDSECGFDSPVYTYAHTKLLEYALKLSELDSSEFGTELTKSQQMLLAGFIILCDWQASSEEKPEIPEPPFFTDPDCETLFKERFQYEPRPVQSAIINIFTSCNKPGLLIIEAPMGEGKTEAALAAAELMAVRSQRSGVFFALPTQATSNAMFSRIRKWIGSLGFDDVHTIDLLHGKKQTNAEFRDLAIYGDENNNVLVHSWLKGRKKAMFADFLIGTIDHLLMAALKQKHVMLRHLALSSKVIIIDECHAYDAYMDVYLCRVLQWLGEYSIPVIILSATLTSQKRRELANAYLGITEEIGTMQQSVSAYPLITYTDCKDVHEVLVSGSRRSIEVKTQQITDEEIRDILEEKLSDGGYVGIIVNTVKRAQEIYNNLKLSDKKVMLLHSRFMAKDRAELEQQLLSVMKTQGKREKSLIVVGTQVLEQSLDIDFDLMITDLCPIDLLIQRMGRLHRHQRPRPSKLRTAMCYITNHSGSEAVYGKYLLERTIQLLPGMVNLPNDISPLVNSVYDGSDAPGKQDYDDMIADKQSRARAFRLSEPNRGKPSIAGLLEHSVSDSDKAAEASVRDCDDSLEMVIISEQERANGISLSEFEAMERSVRLPFFFKSDAIKELEKNYKDDFGNLYLVLGEADKAKLCGYELVYTREKGLEYEKIQSS